MTMTDKQLADRLAMIKEVHEKRKFKTKARKSDIAAKRAVKDYTAMTQPTSKGYDKYDGENINHWTDASKYADQYYGDHMRDTIAMDNDWD